ncbi:hypothetical protein Agabi119p4_4890 [Agaricus bisporus var. burnettii]|uniref:Uncharacterized protein n=1 Tax=Agaricus bisporus var. burnettii TaxID=192524 RepID=A0A8H7F451_AGABI|nr:hypothetical protein Agabi119p4_4890 [Agaricus bisporus var. burnettii]
MSKPRARPLIRAFLIDISGNLHVGSKPTPGAVEAFHRLRASGIPFRLCSNTSKESTASVVQRLNNLGFNVKPSPNTRPFTDSAPDLPVGEQHPVRRLHERQEVWTSIGAVAQYMQNQCLKRPYLLLSPSAKEEVFPVLGGVNDESCDSPYDSVVVGLVPELLDYSHMNTAFRKSNNSSRKAPYHSPPLIATHKAKYIQTENPVGLSLGPGPFVTALETAANVKAHVIGKPTKLFFETVIDDFYRTGELDKIGRNGRIVIIGDDVETDLGDGAVELGLWRILVKTGKYRAGDEARPGIVPPDEVFSSFAEQSRLEYQQSDFHSR